MGTNIHDFVSHREELRRSEWLSKKVRKISIRGDKGDDNLIGLNKLTNKIVSSVYVFCPTVVLGIV